MRHVTFSSSALKLLVVLGMTVSHFGFTVLRFYPVGNVPLFEAFGMTVTPVFLCCAVMRVIGAPLVFFLVAEALRRTRSRSRYLFRLLVLALLSEVPFRLAFFGKLWDVGATSTIVTLFLSALFVCLLEAGSLRPRRRFVALAVVFALFFLLHPDGGYAALAVVLMFYYFPARPYIAAPALAMMPVGLFSVLSLGVVGRYDGRRGTLASGWGKWLFYAFYPLHLLALWAVRCLLFA